MLRLCFAVSYKISDFLTDLLNRLHDDTNQVTITIALVVSTLVVAKMGGCGCQIFGLEILLSHLKSIPVVLQYPTSMPCKEDSKKKVICLHKL